MQIQKERLEDFIQENYNSNPIWFVDFVKENAQNDLRVSQVLKYKNYLDGKHEILQKEDFSWKGEIFKPTKLILNKCEQILNFHDTFLLGRRPTLTGSDKMVEVYNKIYRQGKYHKIDYDILRGVNRYGDIWEYIYIDSEKQIQSKLIDSENSFPIFNPSNGDYIGFIEWNKSINGKSDFYCIYYKDYIEEWNNKNGDLQLVGSYPNISGLPIHYHNYNPVSKLFGKSEICNIEPIISLIEELLSKYCDSLYCLGLNPIPVIKGNGILGDEKRTIPSDVCGFALNLEMGGEFDFANAELDNQSIALLLKILYQELEFIAGIPSVLTSSQVSNVSEVSLNLLYSLSQVKASLSETWLRSGFEERWLVMEKLLKIKDIEFEEFSMIDIQFDYSKPINQSELINNLKTQWDMKCISIESVIEKSPLTNNSTQELERLEKQKQENDNNRIETDNKKIQNSNNKNDVTKDDSGNKLSDKKVG